MGNCLNGKIFLECINLGTDSITWDPHSFLTTASHVQIIKTHTNKINECTSFNDSTYSSDISDEETRKIHKEILLPNPAKTDDTYVSKKPEQLISCQEERHNFFRKWSWRKMWYSDFQS